jgi:hypothetical protein
MTTERIKLTTQHEAIEYLTSRGFDMDRFDKVDANDVLYFETVETCRRCGGAGYYPTPRHGACYECNGRPPHIVVRHSPLPIAKRMRKAELRDGAKSRKAEAKSNARQAEADAKRAAFDASFPGVGEKLAPFYVSTDDYGDVVSGTKHPLLSDFADKLRRYGSLSPKQVEVARRVIDEIENPPAKGKLEGGRREFTGKVMSCKWRSSGFGGGFKITVDLGDGTRVWGSLPSSIEEAAANHFAQYSPANSGAVDVPAVLKGATVTITATVEVSKDDASFGFFKRPSKATLAGVAWVAPELPVVRLL